MKSNIIFYTILTLILSNAAFAKGGGDHDDHETTPEPKAPALPTLQGDRNNYLNVADKFLEKSIVHKPGLDINAYTGDVRTSFSIPLFINNTSLKNLMVSYNSSRIKNEGIGYGMKLNLPKLTIKEDGTIQDERGGDDLIEFQASKLPERRVDDVLKKMQLSRLGSILWFKPQSLEKKIIFAKVNTNNGRRFIELSLDGESTVYGSNGYLLSIFNLHTNGISFYYENEKLVHVQNNDYKTSAAFEYDQDIVKLITIRDENTNKKRLFRFFYEGKNLIQVKRDGAFKSIFIGKYDTIKFRPQVINSNLRVDKKQTLIMNTNDYLPSAVKSEDEDIFVNLNADRFTDKVVTNFKSVNDEISKYMSKLHYNEDCYGVKYCLSYRPNEIKNFIESREVIYKSFIAVEVDGRIEYKEDKSLEKKIQLGEFKKIDLNYSIKKDHGSTYEFIEPKLETIQILRYVDLDQDGLKDIALCSYIPQLDEQTTIMRTGQWDGENQNILGYGLYQFLKNNDATLFNAQGGVATIFLQRANRQKLLTDLRSKVPTSELMVNHSYWKSVNIPFNCHQNSMFSDFTQDGRLSILTGTNLYTIENDQTVKVASLDLEKIRSFFNPISPEINENSIPLEIVELTGNGKLDLVYSYGSYIHPQTRELRLVQNGNEIAIKRTPNIPVLIEETSSYGGRMSVTYGYSGAGLIGERIQIQPNKSDAYVINYKYEGTKIHENSNTFLGFSKVYTEKKYLKDTNHRIFKVLHFDRDESFGPVYVKSRARKNGRVIKTATEDQLSGDSERILTQESSFKYRDLELRDFLSYSYLEKSDVFNLSSGISSNVFSPPVFDELLLPVKVSSSVIGPSGESKNEEFFETIDNDNYLPQTQKRVISNQNGNLLAPVEESFFSRGLKQSAKIGEVESIYLYDSKGRFTGSRSSNGTYQYFYYPSTHSLMLPEVTNTNGIRKKREYDFVTGNVVSAKNGIGLTVYYRYNNDEILDLIKNSNRTLYELTKNDQEVVQFTAADRSFSYGIDGFGKFISLREFDSTSNLWKKVWNQKYDFNEEVKEKNIFALNSSKDNFQTIYSYYSGGNLSQQTTFNLDSGLVEKVEQINVSRELEQNGNLYVHKNVNESIDAEEWVDGLKGVVGRVDSFGYYEYSKNSFSHLVGVENLGMTYVKDLYGNVISSQKTGESSWDEITRKIDLNQQLVTYSTGTKEKSILNSLPSSFESYKEDGELHFKEELTYSKGKISSKKQAFGNLLFTEIIQYNNENAISSYRNPLLAKDFSYDDLGRIKEERITIGQKQLVLSYKIEKGQVVGINNLIHAKYDAQDRPYKIVFSNGVELGFSYNFKGAIESSSILINGKQENTFYTRDINNKIMSVESNIFGNKNYNYENEKLISDKKNLQAKLNLNNFSSLMSTENLSFRWNKNELRSINNIQFYNEFDQQFSASCINNASSFSDCLIKLSSEEYLSSGHYLRKLKLGNITVAVIVGDEVYPTITDHNNAVVGLVSQDGSKVEFLRTFDDYGVESSVSGNKELEKLIPFTYGDLVQIPGLNSLVLQSDTRVYVPHLRQWASIDLAALWKPEFLEKKVGNWNSLEYASGDPINKIDASGFAASDPADGAGFNMTYYHEQKTADYEKKWNSPEGKAYKSEAIKNVGKAAVVGAAVVGGVVAGPAAVTAVAAEARIAAFGAKAMLSTAAKELATAQVAIEAYAMRNPEKAEAIVGSISSYIGEKMNGVDGPAVPSIPTDPYGQINFIGEEVRKMYYLYTE